MQKLRHDAEKLAEELIREAGLKKGHIVVIGCSSSEVVGLKIGSGSNEEIAKILFESFKNVFDRYGIYMAAQCCEHLNRAIVIEKEAVAYQEEVNVIPQKNAGGAFATVTYYGLKNPVVLEEIRADAGIDIGGTLIGMHLKKIAVPLRLSVRKLGEASVLTARTRPKFIGGKRAAYNENLL